MLDTLRKGASGWVAKVMMALLIVSFGVWGIADIFGGYSATAVASVGGNEIELATFEREFKAETERFGQQLGQPLTPADARKYGIDRAALTRLISLAALDEAGQRMGLAVSDVTVAHDIMNDSNLIGPFGKFDKDSFLQALQRNGITERSFIADRRNFMTRSQLIDALQAGVPVSDTLLEVIHDFQSETRDARYVLLPVSSVGAIADPDGKTLEAYYKQAAVHFTLPETRNFSVMTLNTKDVATTITISDEDLQKAYEVRRADFDVPEKRQIDQIPFKDELSAKAALEKLRSGTSIAAVANELGLKPDDVSLGLVSRDQMMSPALADAAFALAPNSFSEPVKGPLGPVILHVSNVLPGNPSTFESAKAKLHTMMQEEKAQDEIYDIQNAIEDARAGGASFEEIASKNGLTIKTYKGVTAKGLTAEGETIKDLPAYRDLLTSVFQNEPGDQIAPSDNGEGGYYWLRVDGVTASALKPLDKVRKDVIALWKSEKRKVELDKLAQSLVDRGNKGESIDALAASINRSPINVPDIKRNSQNDTFSRLAVTRVFATAKGKFAWGPVGLGDSLVVMQVADVHVPSFSPTSGDSIELKANLADSLGADFIATFVAGVQNEVGVKVNEKLLQRVATADSGA